MIKILFISLGCDKNLVDTEIMLGLLVQKGYAITDDEKSKDGSSFEIKRAGLGSASATDLSAESEKIQEKVQEKISSRR